MNSSPLLRNYWDARITDPKILLFMTNCLNAGWYFSLSVSPEFEEVSQAGRALRILSTIQSIMCLLQLALSLIYPMRASVTQACFMISAISQVFGLFDLYDYKQQCSPEEWVYSVQFSLGLALTFFFFHFHCFDSQQRGHFLFGVLYLNAICCGVISASEGFQAWFQRSIALSLLKIGIVQGSVLSFAKARKKHRRFLNRTFGALQTQNYLQLIVDSLQEGVFLLDEAKDLLYTNPSFRQLFKEPIAQVREATNSSADPGEARAQKIFDSLILQYLKQQWNALFFVHQDVADFSISMEDYKAQYNQQACVAFQRIKMFRRLLSDSGKEKVLSEELVCFGQIIDSPEEFKDSILFYDEQALRARRTDLPDLEVGEPSGEDHYFRVSVSTLLYQGSERVYLRVLEVSDKVLYDISKGEKELLSLVNATVSHELRNPLNSIMAQNTAKVTHYKKLKELASQISTEPTAKMAAISKGIHETTKNLEEGLRIQDASAKLMSFLVQDFLDYAQLRSGKFRVNLKPFCIRECINRVMSIQRERAEEKNIELTATFVNVAGSDDHLNPGLEDPVVYSDEQRLMQVLLNLQSNAIKFTQVGRIDIVVEIVGKDDQCSDQQGSSQTMKKALRIKVVDTGVGIPYADQEKLFKLFGFVQATSGLNRNGIGLGLNISKQIVTKFRGTIDFSSIPFPEKNHGSTFVFTFDLETEAEYREQEQKKLSCPFFKGINMPKFVFQWQPQQRSPRPLGDIEGIDEEPPSSAVLCIRTLEMPSSSCKKNYSEMMEGSLSTNNLIIENLSYFSIGKSHGGSLCRKLPKILIADDQMFNIQALKTILTHRFQVPEDLIDQAADGWQAFSKVKEACLKGGEYVLIFMDCNMPIMDGYESTEHIRNFYYHERGRAIEEQPIITAVTGHAEPRHIELCFSHGMNQVLSKPVQAEYLEFTLRQTRLIGEDRKAI